jgi:hypothetical protein
MQVVASYFVMFLCVVELNILFEWKFFLQMQWENFHIYLIFFQF